MNDILIDGKTCKEDVVIPDSVTSIGSSAFGWCKNLTSVTIPDSVTYTGISAFERCKNLTSVIIPDSVTYIDNGAFSDCSNLESITILNPECEIYDYDSTISNGYMDVYYFNGTIYGYENSTAQAYAEKYNCKFVALDSAPEIVSGDINEDGEIGVADFVLLSKYILGQSELTENQSGRADLIADGRIDVFDMIELRKLILDNKDNI